MPSTMTFKVGDILDDNAEALVNTVNCVGVMGRGIALQFKRAFPDNFREYAAHCRRGQVRPGRVLVYDTGTMVSPRYIINFPSKRHWRGKSRIEDIETGLASLVEEIRARAIRSVAIPPLGSGLGGLDWRKVRALIEKALAELDDVRVVVYEPGGRPAGRANRSTDVPRMTPGRAALVALLDRYLRGLLDPFVTLLEAHKLMYFMQVAGEPLALRITKGRYGPYAENLRHVLHAIEGHLVVGYLDGGDRPDRQLRLVPGAREDARKFLHAVPETRKRLAKVVDLVDGFESPFGLELLATTHWVVQEEGAESLGAILKRIEAWNPGTKTFSRRQVELAHNILTRKRWLEPRSPA